MSVNNISLVKYADLLRLLAYDEEFRARFVADPGAVLEDMEIDLDLPAAPVVLPEMTTLRAEYQERLKCIAEGDTTPHALICKVTE